MQWQLDVTSSFSMTSKMPSQARSIQSPVAVKSTCNTSEATSRHLKTMSRIQFCSDSPCLLCFLSITYSIPAAEKSSSPHRLNSPQWSGLLVPQRPAKREAKWHPSKLKISAQHKKNCQVASSCCRHQLKHHFQKSHHILAKVNKTLGPETLAKKNVANTSPLASAHHLAFGWIHPMRLEMEVSHSPTHGLGCWKKL